MKFWKAYLHNILLFISFIVLCSVLLLGAMFAEHHHWFAYVLIITSVLVVIGLYTASEV